MNKIIRYSIILPLILGNSKAIYSQTVANDTCLYSEVDSYPVLLTEEKEYDLKQLKFFIKNHLEYPENGYECTGTVFISVVIEKDGKLSNKKILRKLCPGFDEKSMEIIELMKNWKPGIKNGTIVRTQLIIPVKWFIE